MVDLLLCQTYILKRAVDTDMKMKNKKSLDQKYLQKIENIEFQPVFILGLHRSGTSILYKMLTTTGRFNSVTAYHIINYDELLHNAINGKEDVAKKNLTNFFKEQNQSDRGIDRLKITADFAEEYGFLLAERTLDSRIVNKNKTLFSDMCKKIQFISGNNKPILLKNPLDFSNFLCIKKEFSNAKFIFIHRHPFKTLSSIIKAIGFLINEYSPYMAQLSTLYTRVFNNLLLRYSLKPLTNSFSSIGMILLTLYSTRSTNYYLKNIHKLPKEDYIDVTYEELCKAPNEIMSKIMGSLDMKIDADMDFTTYIQPRKTNLDSSTVHLKRFIFKTMKKYFAKFDYKFDID